MRHPRLTPTFILLALAGGMFISGCGDESRLSDQQVRVDSSFPDWVKDPTKGGEVLGAVGSAEESISGFQFTTDKARNAARRELASMVSARVQRAFKDWSKEGGERFRGAENQVERQEMARLMTEDVSKTVTDIALEGSSQKDLWQDPKSRTVFVWMTIGDEKLAQIATTAAKTARDRIAVKKSYIAASLESDKAFVELEKTIQAQLDREQAQLK